MDPKGEAREPSVLGGKEGRRWGGEEGVITRREELWTPGGDQGTLVTGESGEMLAMAAADSGGRMIAQLSPQGVGGASLDTAGKQHSGLPDSGAMAAGRTRRVGEASPPEPVGATARWKMPAKAAT